MSNIWFTSDTHYGHRNIVRGVSNWRDENGNPSPGPRDFDTLEEHNEALIAGINDNVKEGDTLYHLGDWSFGGYMNIVHFRNSLNVKTIHLCLGNHDHHIKAKKVYHEEKCATYCVNHLFSTVNQVKQKKIGGHMFFLSHYSHRVWDQAHHGAIHLYGHSHGTLPDYERMIRDDSWTEFPTGDYYKCMDVGVDTHPEFRPYNLDEILEIMKDRVPLSVDHHNSRTN